MENIIDIIQKNSLTVRCLPYEVVRLWNYREGDENRNWVDGKGNPSEIIRSVIVQNFDLEYFKNKKPPKWEKRTPEERYKQFKTTFPNGRKLLKQVRKIKKGGWWYVKETKDTSDTVRFNRKYDKFFAPTLQEAIQMYLDSKK